MTGSLELRIRKNSTGIFYIKDSISDIRVSGFMEFPTEAHACMSFCQFIEQQKQTTKIENIDCFKLVFVAEVTEHDIFLISNEQPEIICDGSNCVEMRDLYIDGYKHLYEEK